MSESPYIFDCGSGKILSTQKFFNGNVVGATAQYIFLVKDVIPLALLRGLLSLELKPGTFSRDPNKPVNTSHDDYIAAACNRDFAKRIDYRAFTHLGFLNCGGGFRWDAFLFRFQGFWQHLKICAGVRPGWLGQWIWSKHIELAAKQPVTNQDSWIQSHLMVICAELYFLERNERMKRAIDLWWKAKPKPTCQIVADYIGDSEHPLVQAWERYN